MEDQFTSCLVYFWLPTSDLACCNNILPNICLFSLRLVCLDVTDNVVLLFFALTHQLVNIGINCVFISISLCRGGVLGDWHCAWPCEYTMLCRNFCQHSHSSLFLKCKNVNSTKFKFSWYKNPGLFYAVSGHS